MCLLLFINLFIYSSTIQFLISIPFIYIYLIFIYGGNYVFTSVLLLIGNCYFIKLRFSNINYNLQEILAKINYNDSLKFTNSLNILKQLKNHSNICKDLYL